MSTSDLLQKQRALETYLIQHPTSNLYAWYARQNMEIGKLERAKKICLLGLKNGAYAPLLYALLGDIYLAQGRHQKAKEAYVTCIRSREPLVGPYLQLLKHWGDELRPAEKAELAARLRLIRPGLVELEPVLEEAASTPRDPRLMDNFRWLNAFLQRGTTGEQPDESPASELESAYPPAEAPPPPAPAPAPPVKKPADSPPIPPPPVEPGRTQLTKTMATFTLMQIFKEQGLYDQALEVLELLKSKSSNLERIEREIAEIQRLKAAQAEQGSQN